MPPTTSAPVTASVESRTSKSRAIAAQNADLKVPIYPIDESEVDKRFPVTDKNEEPGLTALCQATHWPRQTSDETELEVWVRFAQLFPLTGLMTAAAIDPNKARFFWSRARVFLSGAGYGMHARIAAILCDLYPICDLDPHESEADWLKALTEARTICGWPAVLGRLSWHALTHVIGFHDKVNAPPHWCFPVALLHLLKHCRLRADGRLAIVYRGTACAVQGEKRSTLPGHWKQTSGCILESLGCAPSTDRTLAHPLTQAMRRVLHTIPTTSLIPTEELSTLPPMVLAGPWSQLSPDPQNTGFFDTACRLDGVWLAKGGKVSAYAGDARDAIAVGWNLDNPGTYANARIQLEAGLPQTYPVSWPADVLLDAFPNVDLSWAPDDAAVRVLIDLPIFASLLRQPSADFAREFPLVAFIPADPTLDASTNQGKSMCASVYARSLSLAAPCLSAPDTSSAPDARAIVDQIVTHGTVALDEWAPPQSRSHPLAHANMQALCTGGTVAAGRVLENGGELRLRHSLICSAKALDLPPDLISRTIFVPMRIFTPQELARPQVRRDCESGKVSMRMRLAAVSVIESKRVQELYDACKQVGTSDQDLRFGDHYALARALYELRTGRAEKGEVGAAMKAMRARHTAHTQDADNAGVLTVQETGHSLSVRTTSLLGACTPQQLEEIRIRQEQVCSNASHRQGDYINPTTLLDIVREVRGYSTLQAMLPSLTGGRQRAPDRAIVTALGHDLRRIVPGNGTTLKLEHGYALERGPDVGNSMSLRVTGGGQVSVAVKDPI